MRTISDVVEKLATEGPLYAADVAELADRAGCSTEAIRELESAYRAAMRGPCDTLADAFRPIDSAILRRWNAARAAVDGARK